MLGFAGAVAFRHELAGTVLVVSDCRFSHNELVESHPQPYGALAILAPGVNA
jgi:hypothetical protein